MLMLLSIEITFQDRLSCLSSLDSSEGGGGGYFSMTAILTKNDLHKKEIYVMEWPVMPAVMSPIGYI